ncbi:ABC transporter substrate-binding protein [Microbacterium sp. P5_E9]
MNRNRSSRARLALVAGATLAALTLAGCSSGSAGGNGGTDEKVTLKYALWDENQKPAMEQIISAFEKDHPNVTVDIQLIPSADYWTKIQTAVAGGSGPDNFWINGPNFQLYASNGQIAPLDDQGIDTSDYPKGLVDLYSYDGKLYGAPKDFDTIGVWYNKALFDAAGVAYPKAGWTWEDFQTAAAELTDPAQGIYGTAAAPYGQMTFYNTIYQAGGEVISADHKKSGYGSPEALEGVEFWTDLIASGESPTSQQMTDTSPFDMWTGGKIAMFWDGSWSPSGYAKSAIGGTIDIAPLPTGPTGNQSIIHGLANVANAKSPHLAEAKEFAAFASGKAAAEIMAKTGAVIPAYNGEQQAWVDSLPQYDLQTFIDEVPTAVPYPISKNTTAWNKHEGDILPQIWAGAVSPEDGLKDLAAKMQAELDKE